MPYASQRLASLAALALTVAVALPAQTLSTSRRGAPSAATPQSPEVDCGPVSATQNTAPRIP
ncbi:MAG: hypothetical protein WEB59_00215 [Thermoanaerobaculia bacterium]